jgi:methionyl-tRNA synthetase
MPQTTEQLARQLGYHFDFSKAIPASAYQWDSPVADLPIAKGAPLFPRIEIAADTKTATAKDAAKQKIHRKRAKPERYTSNCATDTAAVMPLPYYSILTPALARALSGISIDEFMKIQLKTASIISAERVRSRRSC